VPRGEATTPVSGQLVRTSFLGFDSEEIACCIKPNMSYSLLWLSIYIYQTISYTYVLDPMDGDLCLRQLWMETYVSDTYCWRPMSQTPVTGDLCLRHLWLEPYVSDTYVWRPMS